MKKNFFIFFIFLFSFCEKQESSENHQLDDYSYSTFSSGGDGWGTAAADAGGFLAGAGSVASVGSWLNLTPAAPAAWTATTIGGVIGAASASIVYSDSNNGCRDCLTVERYKEEEPLVEYTEDLKNFIKFEEVGFLHNQIVIDYSEEEKKYSPSNYYSFVEKNKDKYGFEKVYIDYDLIKEISEEVKSLKSIDEINLYTLRHLPKEVDKQNFSLFLKRLSRITDKHEAIDFIKSFSEKELRNSRYDYETKAILASYFSTYRYSISLWYK